MHSHTSASLLEGGAGGGRSPMLLKALSWFVSQVSMCCSVLQCVDVCCSVLQCVAVCCGVLKCAVVCCSVLQSAEGCVVVRIPGINVLQCFAVCCSVLQCFAVCCSVLQRAAARCMGILVNTQIHRKCSIPTHAHIQIHPPTHPPTHPLTHPPTHTPTHPLTHPSTHLPTHTTPPQPHRPRGATVLNFVSCSCVEHNCRTTTQKTPRNVRPSCYR